MMRGRTGAACSGWRPEALIARLAGDEALARQLAVLFVAECPRMLAAVRESIAAGSGDEVRRAAHALKGSVSNFTEGPPVPTAQMLEVLGRENELAEAPAVVERLARELEVLVADLTSFSRGQGCAC